MDEFAELGLLAAPFSEAVGGLSGGPLSTMIIMHEFGRHLVVEPFVETVVVAGSLIERAGSEAQKQAYIADIIAGSKLWTLAWTEKARASISRPSPRPRDGMATTMCSPGEDGGRGCAMGGSSRRFCPHLGPSS